jgi:AraC-like DNA-binding protein
LLTGGIDQILPVQWLPNESVQGVLDCPHIYCLIYSKYALSSFTSTHYHQSKSNQWIISQVDGQLPQLDMNPGSFIIYFRSTFLTNFLSLQQKSLPFHVIVNTETNQWLNRIRNLRRSNDGDISLVMTGSLFALLCEILMGVSEKQTIKEIHDAQKMNRKLIAQAKPIIYATRFMRKNIDNPNMSLSMIAEEVVYHPNYFCQEFKSILKVPPMTYLRQLRIDLAMELLEFSDLAIKTICQRVGIRKPADLSTMVKQRCGKTPVEYRRSCRVQKKEN